jgi:predicted esterase
MVVSYRSVLVVAAGLGVACGTANSEAVSDAEALSAPPASCIQPAAVDPGDCNAPLVPGADRHCTMQVGGQTREVLVYAPANWNACHPSALVVDAHGAQETAAENAGKEPFFDWPNGLGSGWRLVADREGFLVVQPQGIGNGWQESDADFMLQIPAFVARSAAIDPKRVYLTGISNGAELVYWTACRDAGVYRAFAPVAGFGTQHCPLTHPAPVIHFHAPTDRLVPLASGQAAFDMLRQSDHCQGGPRPSWTFGAGAADQGASCLGSTPDGSTESWKLVPCDASKKATARPGGRATEVPRRRSVPSLRISSITSIGSAATSSTSTGQTSRSRRSPGASSKSSADRRRRPPGPPPRRIPQAKRPATFAMITMSSAGSTGFVTWALNRWSSRARQATMLGMSAMPFLGSRFRALVTVGIAAAVATAVTTFIACSSDSASPGGSPTIDASTVDVATPDGAPGDSGGVTATGIKIVTASGAPLGAAAGDALALKVVVTMSDGTTTDLPAGTIVTWTAPATIEAQDPDDAGPSTFPQPGAQPTGFFIQNALRPERTDYLGTLFVIDPGSADGGSISVSASVSGSGASSVSATVPVSATPPGDPDAGAELFQTTLACSNCHGQTGGGSPPTDAGADADVVYIIGGKAYPYPAPGLNNAPGSGNVAEDPAWNAALLSMAAQGDMDNLGVALRKPMPDWLGRTNSHGQKLSAQDFAHIYAFLKTQTE